MTNHPTSADFKPRDVRTGWTTLVAVAALAFAVDTHAALASSDFESGPDGWLGYSCPNPGVCIGVEAGGNFAVDWVASGGSPPGSAYLRTFDPGSDDAARMEPNPAKFADLYTLGRTLSFDVLVDSGGGGGNFDFGGFGALAPLVAIESGAGLLVYATNQLPEIDGDWKHYDVVLSNSTNWFLVTSVDPLEFDNPNNEAFAAALGGMTRLTLIGEWLKDAPEADSGGIDNFQVVPLPAALPLFAGALLLGGVAARKRG